MPPPCSWLEKLSAEMNRSKNVRRPSRTRDFPRCPRRPVRLLRGAGLLSAFLMPSNAFCGGAHQIPRAGEIRNFRQFEALPNTEPSLGRAVRFDALVLCCDPGWGQLYLHDGSKIKWFSPLIVQKPLRPGQAVEITGVTTLLEGSVGLTNINVAIKGQQPLPPPIRLNLPQFASQFGQWVETSGTVRVAETSWGRLALVIAAEGQSCLVYLLASPPADDFKRWVGCRVQVRGINASKIDHGQLTTAELFAPSLDEARILEPSMWRLLSPTSAPVNGSKWWAKPAAAVSPPRLLTPPSPSWPPPTCRLPHAWTSRTWPMAPWMPAGSNSRAWSGA
ncbi:hypothetical protein SBV1_30044 [Verrucomicrobia bacterium]|nr:hypothetical protein SBV1_30044 [Verrucomicrobiota bacterium]